MKSKDKNIEEARVAMERALTPRDKNGLIIPITIASEPEVAFYPVRAPDADGNVTPMWFADEFTDGLTPSDLRYVEGCRFPSQLQPAGIVCEKVVFRNPLYNLSPAQNRALQVRTNPTAALYGSRKLDIVASAENTASEEASLDDLILPSPKGLMIRTAKGDYPLCNFDIKALEHRIVHGKHESEPPRDEFEILVSCKGKERVLRIPASDMDNVVKRIQAAMPMCAVAPTISKAVPSIVNYVRQQLSALDDHHYIQRTGFMEFGNEWVYVEDCATPPNKNVIFDTGRSICVDPALSAADAWRIALDFLNVSTKACLMIPLFLMAHLGPLFNLFEAAGCVPRFVIFLNGRSGSLKTSTVIALFRLFWEQLDAPEANFKDTETALEIKLGEANSHVLVIDDFRPPLTAVAGKQNLEKLESAIRFVGDRISKARSNAELGRAREFRPTGCCVVTGEDTGGSHSSLLRCLVLSISKGDIDGSKLRRYQDNPLLMMTHMRHFLTWCGEKGHYLVKYIRERFEAERQFFQSMFKELRLVDTAATLMVIARILGLYGEACGALQDGTMNVMVRTCCDAVMQAISYSENFSKELNPTCMYLRAFFDLWDNGSILIAPDLNSYVAGKMIGYGNGDTVWLHHRELHAKVKKYWQRFDVLFPLSPEKTAEHLADAGLIEVSYETRDGGTKRLFSKKSSLPSRPRLMVLNAVLARQYLERETE